MFDAGGRGGGAAGLVQEERMVVTVDVGLHGLALAAWNEGVLEAAWYQLAAEKGRGPAAWRRLAEDVPAELAGAHLVVETMVHYEGSRVDPADLLELQGICGCVVMARAWSGVEAVEARTWSEGVPKDVRHARLERELVKRGWAAAVVEPKPKKRIADILDAVGLGLWWHESKSTRRWRHGAGW
jgi:hypothetical protein